MAGWTKEEIEAYEKSENRTGEIMRLMESLKSKFKKPVSDFNAEQRAELDEKLRAINKKYGIDEALFS